jgi:hypothetical protein
MPARHLAHLPAGSAVPPRREIRPPAVARPRRRGATGARLITLGLALLALGLAGCATGSGSAVSSTRVPFSGDEVRIETSGDVVYIFARTDGLSRNICASLGGDVARAEARVAASSPRGLQLGRVKGCHTVRHVIVCSDRDGACLAHEERHRREGAFHP